MAGIHPCPRHHLSRLHVRSYRRRAALARRGDCPRLGRRDPRPQRQAHFSSFDDLARLRPRTPARRDIALGWSSPPSRPRRRVLEQPRRSTSKAWPAPPTRTSPSGKPAACSVAPRLPSRSSWRRTCTSHRRTAPRAPDAKDHGAMLPSSSPAATAKTEILSWYLSKVNYGHGAYGIERVVPLLQQAAQGPHVAEAALLAGLPKAPVFLRPAASTEKPGAPGAGHGPHGAPRLYRPSDDGRAWPSSSRSAKAARPTSQQR